MTEQVFLDTISKIEPQVFWMVIKLFAVAVVVLFLKNTVENIVSYTQFRIDRRLSIGVKVMVRGFEGVITDYTFSWIFVSTEKGVMLISLKRWRWEQWEVLDYKGGK